MGVFYALWMTKHNTFRPLAGKCFFCPLGDEVAFDLGGESECKRENLRGDVRSEPVVILDRPDLRLALEAFIEDRHDHQEAAAKARELSADDYVALADAFEKLTELSFLGFLGAGDRLFNPAVNGDPLLFAEA